MSVLVAVEWQRNPVKKLLVVWWFEGDATLKNAVLQLSVTVMLSYRLKNACDA